MFKRTNLLGLVAALACALPGCKSTPTDKPPDSARVASIARIAAYTGTRVHLTKSPGDRPYFESARESLASLSAGGNYDPAALSQALSKLPIKELQSTEGALIVGTAVMLYDEAIRN